MVREGEQGLMTAREVAQRLHVSMSTIERWRFEGHGPRPIRITQRTIRYSRSEVEQIATGSHHRR